MADKILRKTDGGQFASQIASGDTQTLVFTGGGLLCDVFVITGGTATATFYDGTQTTGGTIIFRTNQTHTAGVTRNQCQIPFTTGLLVVGTTGSAGMTVTYDKAGQNGNAE